MDSAQYLHEKKTIVDKALETYFPVASGLAGDVIKAMNYSLLSDGKRLRPILCMAGAEAVGGDGRQVLPVACALEMIHTYSLIHDDLPAMDNDDLRRGRPTNHKVFGEAMALLSGDALLTEAFCLMTTPELISRVSPAAVLQSIGLIARAAGYQGMVAGQVVDIQSEGKRVDLPTVEFIHHHKTGALTTAAVLSGALVAGGNGAQLQALEGYGRKIGLAFQIADDLLNIEGASEVTGKNVGSDQARGKATYPAVVGLGEAWKAAECLISSAITSLGGFDHRADPLREIARYVIERRK